MPSSGIAFTFGSTGSVESPSASSPPSQNSSASVKSATVKNKSGLRLSKPRAVVTFLVGENETSFVVRKDYACHYSPVLKAAFNGDLIEGRTQTYRLANTTEKTVGLLVHWIYTQELDIIQLDNWDKEIDSSRTIQTKIDEDVALVELWILAGKLLLPALQNQVVRKIGELLRITRSFQIRSMKYLYENTKSGCVLRKFHLHMVISYSHKLLKKQYECLPREMLAELLVLYKQNLDFERRLALKPENGMSLFEVPEI